MKKYLFTSLLASILLWSLSQDIQAQNHIQQNSCTCKGVALLQDSVFWTAVDNSDFLRVYVGANSNIINSSCPQSSNYWDVMDYISKQDSVFAVLNNLVCSKIEQSYLESLVRLNYIPITYILCVNPSTGKVINVHFLIKNNLKKYFPEATIKSIYATVMNISFTAEPLPNSSSISFIAFLPRKSIQKYLSELKEKP